MAALVALQEELDASDSGTTFEGRADKQRDREIQMDDDSDEEEGEVDDGTPEDRLVRRSVLAPLRNPRHGMNKRFSNIIAQVVVVGSGRTVLGSDLGSKIDKCAALRRELHRQPRAFRAADSMLQCPSDLGVVSSLSPLQVQNCRSCRPVFNKGLRAGCRDEDTLLGTLRWPSSLRSVLREVSQGWSGLGRGHNSMSGNWTHGMCVAAAAASSVPLSG